MYHENELLDVLQTISWCALKILKIKYILLVIIIKRYKYWKKKHYVRQMINYNNNFYNNNIFS